MNIYEVEKNVVICDATDEDLLEDKPIDGKSNTHYLAPGLIHTTW